MLAPLPQLALLSLALIASGCSDGSVSPQTISVATSIPNADSTDGAAGDASTPIPAPPQLKAKSYFLMDYVSGQVLAATNENERQEPASLTKLMTAYAVFHALKDGHIKLADLVTISPYARDQDGSRMFVDVGTQVSVEDLMQGMIVQSGNDATVALAEHVAGSEPVFVDLMNQYAQQLGMAGTRFQNSPGMPGAEHYTTARDIGLLAAALIREYPEYYKWYSQRTFTWNKITQPNRNGLLDRDSSVDGLKTGHTESAGYCLVSSAKRERMRLIAVVMGSPSVRAREDASAALLNYGFRFYETRRLFAASEPILSVRLWKGDTEIAKLGVVQDVYATFPRGQAASLTAAADVPNPLLAPLATAKSVGKLRILQGGQLVGSYALHPLANASEAGFFGRLADDARLLMN